MVKFYRICCLVMGVLLIISLGITLFVGITGHNPKSELAGKVTVISSLILLGILTVFCLVFSKIGGNFAYRVGFYFLHGGLILLILGFVITDLTCEKYTLYLECGDAHTSYSTYRFEDGSSFELANRMGLESVKQEQYENGAPRYYEAKLAFYNMSAEQKVGEKILTVNHPARVEAYKIYLMSIDKGGSGAILLVKYNPGEYVTILGICTLLSGTFVMCFSGFEKKRKSGDVR